MKIIIPLEDGRVAHRLAHGEAFALVEVDEATQTVASTAMLSPPLPEPGLIPRWLQEEGADVVITAGIGCRDQQILADNGIRVVAGAPRHLPEPTVARFLLGKLEVTPNPCDP